MEEFLHLSAKNVVTPQEISDFDFSKREVRETLSLFKRPKDTIATFIAAIVASISFVTRTLLTHSIFLYIFIPLTVTWIVLDFYPGPHTEYMSLTTFYAEYIVWWVGLGILSSIGLGSGLQSGILFLMPHIIKVCITAQTCNSIDFESAGDMWFRSPKNLYKCPAVPSTTTVTIFEMWQKIILVCVLQSAGTAIGEIPPYWITRGARLAAIEAGTSTLNEIPSEFESTSKFDLVNRFKLFMIWFLQAYGFWGVLVMASYPNFAFDLCGICCGHFLMPFWSFFSATLIGKVFVRNTYQSVMYVVLCSDYYLERIITTLQLACPDALRLDELIRDLLHETREKFQVLSRGASDTILDTASATVAADTSMKGFLMSILPVCWQIFTTCLLLAFFLSSATHFAQYYQMLLDQGQSNELRKKIPHSIKTAITSPMSGRLRLPPPTPGKSAFKQFALNAGVSPLPPAKEYKNTPTTAKNTVKNSSTNIATNDKDTVRNLFASPPPKSKGVKPLETVVENKKKL